MLICAVVVCINVHGKMTKSILSQLSIIMTPSFDIVSPPRIRGGIRQVSGGTTAGPRRIRGGIRVSRGGIESRQVRGSAGGLEKLSAGVSGLVKKPLDCTVHLHIFQAKILRYNSIQCLFRAKVTGHQGFVCQSHYFLKETFRDNKLQCNLISLSKHSVQQVLLCNKFSLTSIQTKTNRYFT